MVGNKEAPSLADRARSDEQESTPEVLVLLEHVGKDEPVLISLLPQRASSGWPAKGRADAYWQKRRSRT